MSLEPQVTERDKQAQFVNEVRQWATSYRELLTEGRDVIAQWNALYNTSVLEQDCEQGTNVQMVPNVTRKQSVVDVIANISSILSAFDAGMNTNFERITL